VETKTITNPNDESPGQLIRFQFSNHLGSASLELDDKANVISYEEYYPYGSTAYQAVDKSIKATAKRYRYTGKERDDETGLNYHGARYYAPWLGMWTRCDPIGISDDLNLYTYVANNPIRYKDISGTKKGDTLPEYKGESVKRFDEKQLNDTIKTVYGELTAKPHKDTNEEAKAIASTIFNRLLKIEKARAEWQKAKSTVTKATATRKTAQKNYEQVANNPSKYIKELKGKDAYDKKLKTLKTAYDTATQELGKAQRDSTAAKTALDKVEKQTIVTKPHGGYEP
jgi:RHS repeat-associated protein